MNTLLTQAQQQIINLQEIIEPLPMVSKKLLEGNDIQVRLYNDETQIPTPGNNNQVSIQVNVNDKPQDTTIKLCNVSSVVLNTRSPGFPNKRQKVLVEKLKSVPVYTVVNNNNEIVISSPREDSQKNTITALTNTYEKLFFWSHDEGPVSILLFFMNEEDACNYLHEVSRKNPEEAEKLGLNIKRIGLDTFYKFNRISAPGVQARLIGDLKELDFIITKINKEDSTGVTINPKQRYAKTWFQGTPIYVIKFNKAYNSKSIIDYEISKETKQKYIFFKKEDADRAWDAFISRNETLGLNQKPNLELYNLENLLLNLEQNITTETVNIVLVPPYEQVREQNLNKIPSFEIEYSNQEKILYRVKLVIEDLKRFYKGLVWLVTSDTLPSEENSW